PGEGKEAKKSETFLCLPRNFVKNMGNEKVAHQVGITMVSRPRHSFTRKPNLSDVKAAGHDMLRLVNRRILLNILSDRQPISRAEIAKISGLNKATISTITSELLKDQCIIEEGSGRTTPIGGKPPTPLRLNAKRFGLFGVDIRADETIIALGDFNNRL